MSVWVICKLFYDGIILYDIEQQLCMCVFRTEQLSYVCTGRVYFKKGIGPVKNLSQVQVKMTAETVFQSTSVTFTLK